MPPISGAAMLRTMIAVSENRMATTSPVTVAVRYRVDALCNAAPPVLCTIPSQGHRKGVSRGAVRWRVGGRIAAASKPKFCSNQIVSGQHAGKMGTEGGIYVRVISW